MHVSMYILACKCKNDHMHILGLPLSFMKAGWQHNVKGADAEDGARTYS